MAVSHLIPARCGGVCYPDSSPEVADLFFREFLKLDSVPETVPPGLCGVVVPHLDFRVTREAYATAWKPYLTAEWPEVFVILGVGHQANREWSTDGRNWQTVYGTVEALDLGVLPDRPAYPGEHSMEFALVCLQAIQRWRGLSAPLKFVPVLCGGLFRVLNGSMELSDDLEMAALVTALQKLKTQYGKKLGWIVSIDGCHLGPRFGHSFPVTSRILQDTRAWEEELWTQVGKPDLNGFIEFLRQDENARYFDGVGALALLRQVLGPNLQIERTAHEQWFEKTDASVVTVSGGVLRLE